ncbi:MAG: hypothetical protein JWM58_2628 [Rhizobium sp.]|nr:hypothetical protein [Rhizobium sp.]
MDNLARKEDLDREIGPFMRKIAMVSDPKALADMCLEFLFRFPPQRGLEIASALTWANPFFMADIPDQNAKDLAINLDLFAEIMMRAKLTASRAAQTNILVACAPKSASTFIQDALQKGLGLPGTGLFTATLDAGSGSALGANLREQEPDELALLRAGLNLRGYVAQHHARCSPYMARLLSFYNVRPIITHRNILDTVVSMDDMLMEWRSQNAPADAHYFSDGMPSNFKHLDRADRLMILAQRHTAWLVQFYITWKKCEKLGLTKPLWISYEQDFLGDKQVLARRVVDFLGLDGLSAIRLENAFEDTSNAGAKRLNKGVAGRGKELPDAVRDQILRIAGYYREEEDVSALIGE